MIGPPEIAGRLRRPVLVVLALLASVAVLLGALLDGGAPSRANAQIVAGNALETTPYTDDSLPLSNVTMIGSAPAEPIDGTPPSEATNETWGIGKVAGGGKVAASAEFPNGRNFPYGLVRYTREGGWTLGPQLLDTTGQPLEDFEPDQPNGLSAPSPLTGQMTADGSGVLVGTIPGGSSREQVMLVRNPGKAFQQTPKVPEEEAGETLLGAGEQLFAAKRAPLFAPIDEEDASAGALLVPFDQAGENHVLHWDGSRWTREAIETPEGESVQVFAIGASSRENAWLLASAGGEKLALYRRIGSVWKPVAPASGEAPGAPLRVRGEALFVSGSPERIETQLLTVTSQGVWIDAERPGVEAPTTVFFKPETQEAGTIAGSWCSVSGGEGCDYQLPEDLPADLPSGPSRSFAWANASSVYGERVITGMREGVSLRLEGTTFKRVLALGGAAPPEDPGGSFGAAFSSATEGWLGSELLPVHLTTESERMRSKLQNWPVPFRHALFAIAPQPGAPVGAASSEALAVGDSGEVARYEPGDGWLPESLLGPGGRHEAPRLRAVAWPRPNRAYAVGDVGQMWLWRGETGLWEPDPATPLNFRGNLLGIAFDPSNPAVGYAVGNDGVLLRFGKTWAQEALPEAVQGASFTSIAFAGSEAIVAFHKDLEEGAVVGGLLVNHGSGWQVDEGAATAMEIGRKSDIPVAVAGLEDGSAAVATYGGPARVFEREGASGSWQATAAAIPGAAIPPASLALFREGGALRVIAAGVAPIGTEVVAPPPPGFPPTLEEPAPVPSVEQQRGVVRQTAGGWSDEEHELNLVKEPPVGPYKDYDSVYQPDPLDAVLIGANGAEGWAVGGIVNEENALDTSDVERYEANPAEQPSVDSPQAPLPARPDEVTLAIAGGAQCAAPCADRAKARIGPDVWTTTAIERAAAIQKGVSAFIFTGPRLSTGQTEGPEPAFPFGHEFDRYAEILAGSEIPSGSQLPVYAAATATDLNARPSGGTEESFVESLAAAQLPQSLDGASDELTAGERAADVAAPGGEAAYYSFSEQSETHKAVRVIVLDDTHQVGSQQLGWLQRQLEQAKSATEATIVVGNADLNAQINAGNAPEAEAVVAALVAGEASAYFYDSPEENVETKLLLARNRPSAIPAFGSGTLGYINAQKGEAQFEASGFLLAHVELEKRVQGTTNRVQVHPELIPVIGELALEAEEGTLLRRSQTALFAALARRPRAGNRSPGGGAFAPDTDPYVQIPSECVGAGCPNLLPKYTFSSSNPEVGNFVARNVNSAEAKAVEVGANGAPVEANGTSGLFCAYNAGETTVTISAGGLAASLKVVVQEGSQRRPCVPPHPHSKLASTQQQTAPPPAPTPTPTGAAPASAPPVVPLPAPPTAVPAPPPARPAAAAPFFFPGTPPASVLAFLPPPVPTPARPTPPSGTSAVTSPVEVAEKEEEHEEAPESVSNQAVAYRAPEHDPAPAYILGIVVLAAFAGASARRRPRRDRREIRVAPATINQTRASRHAERYRNGSRYK